MIKPGVLHRGVLGDEDLQVRPAVGAEQRDEAREPLARDPQHLAPGRCRGVARAAPRRSRRPRRSSRRASAAGRRRTSSRGRCAMRRLPSGCSTPGAATAMPGGGSSRTRPVGGRVRPRLADREVAVEPPAAALQVGERRDRVREERVPAAVAEAARACRARGCRRRRRRCRARRVRAARRAGAGRRCRTRTAGPPWRPRRCRSGRGACRRSPSRRCPRAGPRPGRAEPGRGSSA